MPRPRFQPPDQLPEATAFGHDDSVRGSLNVVELLKTQRWLWDELREACDLSKNWGRPRKEGHWELAMVAFTVSGHVDIRPWHDSTTPDIWKACGFPAKPSYHQTWRHLRELEQCEEAFIDALASLIQRARKHEPRVGAHVHIDGTEDETHAGLLHDCAPGEECPYRQRRRARRAPRVSSAIARVERQAMNAEDPDGTATPELRVELVQRGGRTFKRVRVGGCWYRTIDRDAGVRAYEGTHGAKRFWHGYYNQKGIDHFTGGVLFAGVYNASVQEYLQFPDLYEKLMRVIGAPPQTVIADKGQSVTSVFELCTRHGTAAVIPWRACGGWGDRYRPDYETHDRHGIPRCKHCGGTTRFRRFTAAGRSPRISFVCLAPATPGCHSEQSIACSTDWRLLIPLWRTDPLYHELRASLGSFEGTHDYWRDRYQVAADTLACRPKVISIRWHQLRSLVAGVVEWLRICVREGWLGSARHNTRHPRRHRKALGVANAQGLIRSRVRNGLTVAYGREAARLGLGEPEPPSSRRPVPKPAPSG